MVLWREINLAKITFVKWKEKRPIRHLTLQGYAAAFSVVKGIVYSLYLDPPTSSSVEYLLKNYVKCKVL